MDYEIRLQGHLDGHWAAWFPGMTLTLLPDGTTALAGPVVDQAELHGVLARVRDLGVPLVSVAPAPGAVPGRRSGAPGVR